MQTLARPVWAALLTVYVVWGSTYFAIHLALAAFPPFLLMGSRFLVAGGLLLIWARVRGAPWPGRREWRAAALIGTLMLGGGMGLTAVAQQYVSSGLTAVFIACSPLVMSLMAGMHGEWPNRREWGAIALGLCGALMLASSGQFAAQPVGLVALLAAILCWDGASVLSQKTLRLAPGSMGYASEMLCGAMALLLVAALRGEAMQALPSLEAWLAWGYLVGAGSLLAFTAYLFLLSRVKAGLAASYAYVNPVIALVLGAWAGGERLSMREGVAVLVILAAVLALTLGHTRPAR